MGQKQKKKLFPIMYLDLTQRSFEPLSLYFCREKKTCKNATSLRVSIILRVVLHLFMHLIYYLRGSGRIFPRKTHGFFTFTAIKKAKPSKKKILCCRIMVYPGLARISYSGVLYLIIIKSSSEFVASKFYL